MKQLIMIAALLPVATVRAQSLPPPPGPKSYVPVPSPNSQPLIGNFRMQQEQQKIDQGRQTQQLRSQQLQQRQGHQVSPDPQGLKERKLDSAQRQNSIDRTRCEAGKPC